MIQIVVEVIVDLFWSCESVGVFICTINDVGLTVVIVVEVFLIAITVDVIVVVVSVDVVVVDVMRYVVVFDIVRCIVDVVVDLIAVVIKVC